MGYVVYKMTSFNKYSEYRKTVPDKRSSQRIFQNQINFLFFFLLLNVISSRCSSRYLTACQLITTKYIPQNKT